jgi:hypothetical protein
MFWLFCGAMLASLTLTVPHDEEQVHAAVKDSLFRRTPMAFGESIPVHHGQDSSSAEGLSLKLSGYRRILDDLHPSDLDGTTKNPLHEEEKKLQSLV